MSNAFAHLQDCKSTVYLGTWYYYYLPIALYSTSTSSFPLLHEAEWTTGVERHARRYAGNIHA
eukprot:1804038-Rhodomonas_salina.1